MTQKEDNEIYIWSTIFTNLRIGTLSIKEVREVVIDTIEYEGLEKEISKDWAYKEISDQEKSLISESQKWKRPTDTEKLIKAFDELCDNNIIALHNPGFEHSESVGTGLIVADILRENEIQPEGFCFYNTENIYDNLFDISSGLYLTFQDLSDPNDDLLTVEVGKKIAEILRSHHFDVEWNETAEGKILLKNFKWRLVHDQLKRDIFDPEVVINRFTKKLQL